MAAFYLYGLLKKFTVWRFLSPSPPRAGVRSRHRIVTAAAPGMATAQPFERQPKSFKNPIAPEGLQSIKATGGRKPA